MQSRGAEVVEALSEVEVLQVFDTFQFDDDAACDQQIGHVIAHRHAVIHDFDWVLLDHGKPCLPQLMRESVPIYLFEKTSAQSVADPEGSANDRLAHGL